MKSFSTFDRILFFVSVSLFLIAAYLLYDDSILFPNQDGHGQENEIGKVIHSHNDVRRKGKSDFTFGSLSLRSTLYSGDTVFTGGQSSLELQLNDGTEIKLVENSLIVLNTTGDELVLDLKYGDIAQIQKNNMPPKAVNPNRPTRKPPKIKIVSGGIEIKDTLPKEIPPTLVFPEDQSTYYPQKNLLFSKTGQESALETRGNLEFKWAKTSNNPGVFEVATTSDFKSPLHKTEVRENIFSASNLTTPGKYYWRVTTAGKASKTFTFNVVEASSLEILSPKSLTQIWLNQPFGKQEISWQPQTLAKIYHVEVATDREFKTRVVYQSTHGTRTLWLPTKIGKYFIRVSAKVTPDSPSYISQSGVSEIEIFNNEAPILLSPATKSTLILKGYKVLEANQKSEIVDSLPDKSSFEFKWQAKGFENTTIEISSTALFKDIILSKKQNSEEITVDKIAPGNYFWRVVGSDSRHQTNLASSVGEFTVISNLELPKLSAPILSDANKRIELRPLPGRSPSSNSKWYQAFDLSGQGKPYLQWSEVSKAKSYQITISKDANATQKLVSLDTNKLKYEVDGIKPGKYFWTVKANNNSNSPNENPPTSGTLVITVPAPKLNQIAAQNEKVLTEEDLNSPRPNASMSWTASPLAEAYQLDVSSNDSFKNSKPQKIRDTKTTFTFPGNGTHFWRVTALDGDGKPISNPSETSSMVFNRSVGLYSPLGISPKADSEILFLTKGASHLVLNWTKVNGATEYQYELAGDGDFKTILHQGKSRVVKEYVELKLPQGTSFWRVRAQNQKYKSEWSPAIPFRISYEKK